jgi:hypothetical protein
MRQIVVVLLAALALSACATARQPRPDSLHDLYVRTVFDAAVHQRQNLRELRPLVPDEHGEVLVASFTGRDGAPGTLLTALQPGMWVTGVPEVQEKCRQFSGDVLLQLRQMLGLPPSAGLPRVLVLRAHIRDLFRPSPDPDPTTVYPCQRPHDAPIPDNCGNAFPPSTSPDHYQWMADSFVFLHQLPQGWPWTHLGYTYNWTPGADRYGASEYILRGDAVALIVENTTPLEYCKPPAVRSE